MPTLPSKTMDDFDSPLEVAREREAEEKREAAFLVPQVMWQGQALEPWSLMRHALHKRLMQHLCPVPGNLWGEDVEAHAADAMLFLWLASHPREMILILAGQPQVLWMRVFDWAEKSLPRKLWPEALEKMVEVFDQGKVTETAVRPEAGGRGVGKPPARSR